MRINSLLSGNQLMAGASPFEDAINRARGINELLSAPLQMRRQELENARLSALQGPDIAAQRARDLGMAQTAVPLAQARLRQQQTLAQNPYIAAGKGSSLGSLIATANQLRNEIPRNPSKAPYLQKQLDAVTQQIAEMPQRLKSMSVGSAARAQHYGVIDNPFNRLPASVKTALLAKAMGQGGPAAALRLQQAAQTTPSGVQGGLMQQGVPSAQPPTSAGYISEALQKAQLPQTTLSQVSPSLYPLTKSNQTLSQRQRASEARAEVLQGPMDFLRSTYKRYPGGILSSNLKFPTKGDVGSNAKQWGLSKEDYLNLIKTKDPESLIKNAGELMQASSLLEPFFQHESTLNRLGQLGAQPTVAAINTLLSVSPDGNTILSSWSNAPMSVRRKAVRLGYELAKATYSASQAGLRGNKPQSFDMGNAIKKIFFNGSEKKRSAPSPGNVRVVMPNGSVYEVPPKAVEEVKRRGGKVQNG